MNPAETPGVELTIFPEPSKWVYRFLTVALGVSALSSVVLGQSWWARVSPPWSWLAFAIVTVLLSVLWRIWRGLRVRPVPRLIRFLANGRVIVTGVADSTPIECIPGALVMMGGLLAFTLCPRKPTNPMADIQWLSGVDAIGDEKWRQLRVWLVWHRRARKSLG